MRQQTWLTVLVVVAISCNMASIFAGLYQEYVRIVLIRHMDVLALFEQPGLLQLVLVIASPSLAVLAFRRSIVGLVIFCAALFGLLCLRLFVLLPYKWTGINIYAQKIDMPAVCQFFFGIFSLVLLGIWLFHNLIEWSLGQKKSVGSGTRN